MDPQQELFTAILTALKEQGYDVYDGFMPPENTTRDDTTQECAAQDDPLYPFVYLADSHQVDAENKSAIFGDVYQTIHVWHDSPKRRGTVSNMLGNIKALCRSIRVTDNFSWYVRSMDQRILTDTTTKVPLLHGLLDVGFKFSGR